MNLVEEHLSWALQYKRVLRRQIRGIRSDDLHAAVLFGLVDAARRYRPGMGATFQTFAKHRIRGAVYDERRAQRVVGRQRGEAPVVLSLHHEPEDGPSLLDTLAAPDPAEPLEEATSVLLARAMKTLPARHRDVLERVYLLGESQTDIAEEWGISGSRVCQIVRVALNHVRAVAHHELQVSP